MERSTTDIELTFAKAERGNRQDCTDKGRGMGGTAEEGNKETAWKYLDMIELDYGCVILERTMKQIQIPTWQECSERADQLERTDRTVAAAAVHGSELTQLENMVYAYDDDDPDRSRQYLQDLKELVEWCVNNPDHALSQHEQL